MEEFNHKLFSNNALMLLLSCLIVSIIFGLVSWGYFTITQATNLTSKDRTMTLSGSGKITAIPDIATISFEIVNEGKSIQTITQDNNTKMTAVVNYLKQEGIDDKDIKTSQYNIDPVYEQKCSYNTPTSPGTITKQPDTQSIETTKTCSSQISFYRISQTINVKIRDFNKIDNIIGKVSELGINNISNLAFTIDDPELLENQAKIEAIQNIKKRAFQFSNETGIKLGRIINISESNYYPEYQKTSIMLNTPNLTASTMPSPIEPGSLEINKTMSITYQIK